MSIQYPFKLAAEAVVVLTMTEVLVNQVLVHLEVAVVAHFMKMVAVEIQALVVLIAPMEEVEMAT